MAPPFRANHIGSLIRQQYLLDAQLQSPDFGHMHTQNNESARSELINMAHDAERQTIKDVDNEQVNRGITPITSGEFERSSFVTGFFENFEGIEIRLVDWKDFRTDYPITRPYLRRNTRGRDQPIATGRVRLKQSIYMNEWLYLRSLLPEERWKDVKITIPAPNWSHTQLKNSCAYTSDAYTSDEEYLKDVG